MQSKKKLIIFTRFPEPGKTKTRLIPHLGAEGAAQLQKEMTEHVVRQARRTDTEIEIRYTGGAVEQMRDWLGADLRYVEQGGGDLGERMQRAFSEQFDSGADRVVIVGSDCPSNGWKNMQSAFQRLDAADCVIGPATDGGYYLIGLGKTAPQLFQGMDWGGEKVLEQALAAAASLSVSKLKPLGDVDLPEDIPPRISVVIPTLNEEKHIFQTLEKIKAGFNVETLVVDGGSTDGTRAIAEAQLSYFMKYDNGRAARQNAGACAATGEILLTLSDPSVALGAFSFKVDSEFPGRGFIEDTANWRSKKRGLPFGDQGFFLRRKTFDAAGGFPDQPIMEDYAFARTLRRHGKIVTVPQPAITSGRRWQQRGVFKVTLINKLMIIGYHLGIPPEKLAAFYRK
jgi:rSAM/selenodomain-associated transferase 1